MNRRFFAFTVMLAFVLGLFLPAGSGTAAGGTSAAAAPGSRGSELLPGEMLNANGTLRLDSTSSGSLNVDGWDVQLDAALGPVFSRPGEAGAGAGTWSAVGSGGSGALNKTVYALAMLSGKLYVGGAFTNAANIETADYIASWDPATGEWAAMGTDDLALQAEVHALEVLNGELYVGGDFQNAYGISAADYIAKWNPTTGWAALGSDGGGEGSVNGWVLALATDGVDDLYIGGGFLDVKNSDGSTLTAGDIVAVWNTTEETWSALGDNGSAHDGSLGYNPAYAIALHGTRVYVGGNFSNVSDWGTTLPAADNVAYWDTVTEHWYALGNNGQSPVNGSISGDSDSVNALAVDSQGNVYIGGLFWDPKNKDGTTAPAADMLAVWDPGTEMWSSVGVGETIGEGPFENNPVYAVVVDASDGVYAGGHFNYVNTPSGTVWASAFAYWDGSVWNKVGDNGYGRGVFDNASTSVFAVQINGADVYAGGDFLSFTEAGVEYTNGSYAAVYDSTAQDWSALGDEQGGFTGRVRAVAVSGTNVYVGGDFERVIDSGEVIEDAGYVALWDGQDWQALGGDWGPALGGPVHAIAVSGGSVYVGGEFEWVNGTGDAGAYIARWDSGSRTWFALGDDGSGQPCLNGPVYAVAVDGGDLYVGGSFVDVRQYNNPVPAARYVARWDGTDWWGLESYVGPDVQAPQGTVRALAVNAAGDVYVGGEFPDMFIDGSFLNSGAYVGMWNASGWHTLGHGAAETDPSLNGAVQAIAIMGGDVFVGGQFTDVNNNGTEMAGADYIARWDGTNWSELGTGSAALNGTVRALAAGGTQLFVGGDFTEVNTGSAVLTEAAHAAQWSSPGGWLPMGNGGAGVPSISSPAASVEVDAIGVGDGIYVGGYFYDVNNGGTLLAAADHLARYSENAPRMFSSQKTYDGWILESKENSGAGGTKSANGNLSLGDNKARKQYRVILSFNTKDLPDSANILWSALVIHAADWSDPSAWDTLGLLHVDIKKGSFKGEPALQLGDFKAAPSASGVAHFGNVATEDWGYSTSLSSLANINKKGVTQFRLQFDTDDDGDGAADFVKFMSGSAGADYRPQLIISYTLP